MISLIVLKILPRSTPQDVSQGCEKKSCASCVKDIEADVPNNDIENVVESTEKLFYEVFLLDARLILRICCARNCMML